MNGTGDPEGIHFLQLTGTRRWNPSVEKYTKGQGLQHKTWRSGSFGGGGGEAASFPDKETLQDGERWGN